MFVILRRKYWQELRRAEAFNKRQLQRALARIEACEAALISGQALDKEPTPPGLSLQELAAPHLRACQAYRAAW